MLSCILKSRVNHGCESSGEGLDAAVNAYLTRLLLRVATVEYMEECQRYVSLRAIDVSRLVDQIGGDAYRKFLLYRVNADYLLLWLSIFGELRSPQRDSRTWYRKSQETFEGYGRTYYAFASTYYRVACQRPAELVEVLADLSSRFSRYALILHAVRRDYFDCFHQLNASRFGTFLEEVRSYERSLRREEMLDTWLDLYGAWLQNRDSQSKQQLDAMTEELRELDPTVQLPVVE